MGRYWLPVAAFIAILSAPGRAEIIYDGENLIVRTRNLGVTFRGADIVSIENRVTDERYARGATGASKLLRFSTLRSGAPPLRCTGWRQGTASDTGRQAAMTTFAALDRTVTMSVVADMETQDITVTTWGESATTGVSGLAWGIRGLDLTSGRMVIPANGGRVYDRSALPTALKLDYPTHWEAQMAIWEGRKGGFIVYSRDDQCKFKDLHIGRSGDYLDASFETEADAPWTRAGGTPQIEWRINAFSGDWRVPAAGYRKLMHFLRPPIPADGARAWVRGIRAVVSVTGREFDLSILSRLAGALDPRRTLIYLANWRRSPYDADYPDYTPSEAVSAFVERAHALHFRLMLHTDLPGISPNDRDFSRVSRWQVRHPETGALQGWYWDKPVTLPHRFAYVNPAARAWREILIERLRPVIADLRPDAIHLDVSGTMWNDGSGSVEGRTYPQGSMTLHSAILKAFPDLSLGGESLNELTSPYEFFAQRWLDRSLPSHPISAALFGDQTTSYGHLGLPNPDSAPRLFLDYVETYDGQGVVPTLALSSPADLDAGRAGAMRLLREAGVFQRRDLAADPYGGPAASLFRWQGADGAEGLLKREGSEIRMTVDGEIVSRRISGATRASTRGSIARWPAWNATGPIGLDPQATYWIDPSPPDARLPHVAEMPEGVSIREAQVSDRFALFRLQPAERTIRPLLAAFASGTTTVREQGHELPLERGASVVAQDMTAGGLTRPSLLMHPPYTGQKDRETTVVATVTLRDTPGQALAFSCGLADSAEGSDGVSFAIEVNGKRVFEQTSSTRNWFDGRIDLSAWAGTDARIRLITTPGPAGDANSDHAAWSDLRLIRSEAPSTATVKVAVPTTANGNGISCSAGVVTLSGAEVTLPALAANGSAVLFLAPGVPVRAGDDLLALPFSAEVFDGALSGLPPQFGAGSIVASSAGGSARERSLNAHAPGSGYFAASWALALPDKPGLRLRFSAGLADGSVSTGVRFQVRVNGATVWEKLLRQPGWTPGELDLSAWRGRAALVQLLTDPAGDPVCDWARWTDLIVAAE